MGKETGISWTDHTFNPWWGCTKVSPGCDNCYAKTVDDKWGKEPHWGKGAPRRTFGDSHWLEPRAWNRKAEADGVMRKVFCASMADVMDDEAPKGQRERLWSLIDETPNLFWQLLTKRPHRFVKYLPERGFRHQNVMLGTTVEEQKYLEPRVEAMIRGANHLYDRAERYHGRGMIGYRLPLFISYEPALGSLSLTHYADAIDWLIFGGETGIGRRPMEESWARNIKAECDKGGVAFFMKQMSAHNPAAAAALIPADMLVRNFPKL